jgi:hypothetical protein
MHSPFGLFQSKSHFDRPVQFLNLGATQGPDEACQLRLAEAYEVVAQDPALMFQAFVDSDRDLGRESVSASKYWCAHNGGESGINQDLAAHNDEAPIKFGVVTGRILASRMTTRMMNAIDFASSHLVISVSAISVAG